MNVMNFLKAVSKSLAIAWNGIRIEFADRSSLIFLVVLPLVFTYILAIALGGGGSSSGGDNRYVLSVVDNDHSRLSTSLVGTLESSSVIRPVVRPQEEAGQLLKDRKLSILTIPSGFGDNVLAGKQAGLSFTRAQDDPGVLVSEQAVQAAAAQLSSEVGAAQAGVAEAERIRPFADPTSRQAYFEQSLTLARQLLKTPQASVQVTAAPTARVQEATSFQQSSAGQLVTWVMITLVGAAEVLVSERIWGTLRRLMSTPISKPAVLGGMIVGRLGVGLGQMGLMISFGAWVLGVDWGRSPAALLLVISAFALSAVAFGVMLGTFATTRNQAMWLVIFFSMILSALGGAWWPLEITPSLYQEVVKALPTTWAMTGLTDVIVRGQGVAAVLPETGILLAFAVAFFLVGIWRFRHEWAR